MGLGSVCVGFVRYVTTIVKVSTIVWVKPHDDTLTILRQQS